MDLNDRGLKGVVFDKDGTLFDFNATWASWARAMLTRETAHAPQNLTPLADALGFELTSGQFRKDSVVIASTAQQVAEVALPYLADTSVAPVIARFNADATNAPQVEAAPLIPLLTGLRDSGLKLGVATNDAEAPARAHLDAAQITSLFDFIAGFDSGFGGKPAPGQLHGFCRATGLSADDCAMVGDSTHDLHAGRAAGMMTIAVLTGIAERAELQPYADVVLDSIADLPGWLGLDRAALG